MSHRHVTLFAGALALVFVLMLVVGTPSAADESGKRSIAYLSVNGAGPNATAWYQGAPPTGVRVQDALDRFAEQGYRVTQVRPYQRPVITLLSEQGSVIDEATNRDEFFIILLEK